MNIYIFLVWFGGEGTVWLKYDGYKEDMWDRIETGAGIITSANPHTHSIYIYKGS